MNMANVLVIDSDDYSASVLLDDLQRHGFGGVRRVRHGLEVPRAIGQLQPEVVLFNHHFDRPDELLSCCTAKLTRPQATVVAIAAAGPAIKAVRQWGAETSYIDVVVEKPLSDSRLVTTMADLARARQSVQALERRAQKLASLLPDGALEAVEDDHAREEEVFEAAVVFTDIRRSSDLITRVPPREFFQLLNRTLSAQARLIRAFEGQVVKYTGDGLMAVFRGRGRAYLAVRCSQDLAGSEAQSVLPFGIGVADGLVLAGLVGAAQEAEQWRQYDVIGATVHLSSRLCSQAGPGQVMATRSVYASSRLQSAWMRTVGPVPVRGFPAAIDCVVLDPRPAQQAA